METQPTPHSIPGTLLIPGQPDVAQINGHPFPIWPSLSTVIYVDIASLPSSPAFCPIA